MWRTPGRFEIFQEHGQVVTSGLIETLLGELSQRREDFPRAAFSGLTQRLDNAGSGAIPGFTALETYADAAVAGYRGGGTLLRVGPAVQWRPDRKRRAGLPGSAISAVPWGAEGPQLAWHDETLIVVRVGGSAELVLDYHDEPNDHRTERELTRVLQPLTRRYVDWRLYAGTNTEVVEGEAPLRPHGRRRWRAAIRLPAGIAGVLIGKVVRRLGPIRTVHDRDDSQSSRLDAWESHHPVVAAHFPQLGATRNEESVLGVFVHGTRSCGVPALQELAHHLATPFVRYEHDTFRPVVENARELSDLVAQHVRAKHLLLVGHSRGGLVARLAAAYLRQAGTLPVVDVWTFGTPHHGTPLVSRGLEFAGIGPLGFWRKLALLSKLDVATDEEGNPIEDAVSATLSILLRSARLPPGIAIMAPGSEALAMIQNDWNTVTQRAVGGAANRDDPRGGYSVFLRRMTSEIFAGQPNDFIVGQSSSTGSTGPIVLAAPCSHSGYFRDSSVRQMLASAP